MTREEFEKLFGKVLDGFKGDPIYDLIYGSEDNVMLQAFTEALQIAGGMLFNYINHRQEMDAENPRIGDIILRHFTDTYFNFTSCFEENSMSLKNFFKRNGEIVEKMAEFNGPDLKELKNKMFAAPVPAKEIVKRDTSNDIYFPDKQFERNGDINPEKDPELDEIRERERLYSDIFSAKDPSPEDIIQTDENTGFFLAQLAHMAAKDPDSIRRMIEDNNDGTVTVHFFAMDGKEKKPLDIRVDKTMPETDGRSAMWVRLMEKAYVASRLHTSGGIMPDFSKDKDAYIHINGAFNNGNAYIANIFMDSQIYSFEAPYAMRDEMMETELVGSARDIFEEKITNALDAHNPVFITVGGKLVTLTGYEIRSGVEYVKFFDPQHQPKYNPNRRDIALPLADDVNAGTGYIALSDLFQGSHKGYPITDIRICDGKGWQFINPEKVYNGLIQLNSPVEIEGYTELMLNKLVEITGIKELKNSETGKSYSGAVKRFLRNSEEFKALMEESIKSFSDEALMLKEVAPKLEASDNSLYNRMSVLAAALIQNAKDANINDELKSLISGIKIPEIKVAQPVPEKKDVPLNAEDILDDDEDLEADNFSEVEDRFGLNKKEKDVYINENVEEGRVSIDFSLDEKDAPKEDEAEKDFSDVELGKMLDKDANQDEPYAEEKEEVFTNVDFFEEYVDKEPGNIKIDHSETKRAELMNKVKQPEKDDAEINIRSALRDARSFTFFINKLEKAKTLVNSSEYKNIISCLKTNNNDRKVKSMEALDDNQTKALKLISVGIAIDAYLSHKGRDGVKANVFGKLAAVEELHSYIAEELNKLDFKPFTAGKGAMSFSKEANKRFASYNEFYDSLTHKSVNGYDAPKKISEEKIDGIKAASIAMKKPARAVLAADSCMCRIIYGACKQDTDMRNAASISLLRQMRDNFSRVPETEKVAEKGDLLIGNAKL